jgi:hypothetical protein
MYFFLATPDPNKAKVLMIPVENVVAKSIEVALKKRLGSACFGAFIVGNLRLVKGVGSYDPDNCIKTSICCIFSVFQYLASIYNMVILFI